jgi:Na+/H+-dicarboxylate symporter
MKSRQITQRILAALVLGVAVGMATRNFLDEDTAKQIAGYYSLLTDVFLHLIKMIIAPLVFATVVAGIANTGDTKTVGRIGLRALGWFIVISFISLSIGLVMATILNPGDGLHIDPTASAESVVTGVEPHALSLKGFLDQVFPSSVIDAMAKNNILQILVFAVFFGFALASLGKKTESLIKVMHEAVPAMLNVTSYVMLFAPFGVFGAVSSVVTLQGLGVLVTYGKYLGGFYLSLLILWVILIAAGRALIGPTITTLVRMVREPMLLAFSTASSEAAYPGAMQKLARFGVREDTAGLVLPLGYSFNLAGSMINMTFASLFIAQVCGVELSLTQKLTMLLVLMVSSKGIAGVPRASLVVVAAVLPIFHIPEAGLLLVFGIDHFLDMGRSATNVLGNCIVTAVVANREGELAPGREINEDAEVEISSAH